MLIVGTGCGPAGPDVVKVRGRITLGGKPVSHVVLQFYPERGRPSSGRTDAAGNFAPEFSSGISHGVLPGKTKVSIHVLPERIDAPVDLHDKRYHPKTAEIVKVFGSWNETPLVIEISHETPDIDIELNDYWPQAPDSSQVDLSSHSR